MQDSGTTWPRSSNGVCPFQDRHWMPSPVQDSSQGSRPQLLHAAVRPFVEAGADFWSKAIPMTTCTRRLVMIVTTMLSQDRPRDLTSTWSARTWFLDAKYSRSARTQWSLTRCWWELSISVATRRFYALVCPLIHALTVHPATGILAIPLLTPNVQDT